MKTFFRHLILAANLLSTVPVTPEECKMHQKFLQGEFSKAE